MQDESKFEFFYKDMVAVYEGFIKYIFTMSASLLIVIGWFLTEENISQKLGPGDALRWSSTIALVLTAVANMAVMINVSRTLERLRDVAARSAKEIGIDPTILNDRVSSKRMVAVFFLFHLMLMALIDVLTWVM